MCGLTWWLTATKDELQLRNMNNSTEHIRHEEGNDEAWVCICTNTPNADGFYPCDSDGNQVEPDAGWNDLYVCAKCGRIINQNSLEVVGSARS
jgi:hypothetical protein